MGAFVSGRIERARDVVRWDEEADVAVVGLGAAGACAAIGARESGASVLVAESASGGGGTSATSSGQLYLGGGTALQKACGFEDSPGEMFKYLMDSCGPGADAEKVRLFCERSPEHYDWLVARGVPFKPSFVPHTEAANPPGDDGLTYTGSELAHPFRERARPAPRGHNVRKVGDSGDVLMRALLERVERSGARVLADLPVKALVRDDAGRVVGVCASRSGKDFRLRAARGVVLATGGFQFNRELLARHAPPLLDCQPIGCEKDDGSGILLGMAAGAEAVRMASGCVILPFAKPRHLTKGILVNAQGQRFVNEDVYQALHGEIALYRQGGRVYLVLDRSIFARSVYPTEIAATGDTPEQLEAALEMPPGSLVHTLAAYNAGAARGEDPEFRKAPEWLVPLDNPPYAALDLRLGPLRYPFFTLGGLRTAPGGEVLTPDGEPIPGLYAAGRSTSGIPAQGYNSGTSLSDATFFGRLAGASAARAPRANA